MLLDSGLGADYRKQMEQVLALFDFDGTLTQQDSCPGFLFFCHGFWGTLRRLPAMVGPVLAFRKGSISRQELKEALLSTYFKGWSKDELRTKGHAYVNSLGPRAFRPGALECLQQYKRQGARVIVISASPEEWIGPFAVGQGVEYLASRLEYGPQGFTGKLQGRNCRAEEKVTRLKALIPDLADYTIHAYGDSNGDREMLAIAQKPCYRPFR